MNEMIDDQNLIRQAVQQEQEEQKQNPIIAQTIPTPKDVLKQSEQYLQKEVDYWTIRINENLNNFVAYNLKEIKVKVPCEKLLPTVVTKLKKEYDKAGWSLEQSYEDGETDTPLYFLFLQPKKEL